jgi:hypothetical protein
MPAPWTPDSTKDATLKSLADAFVASAALIPHFETAWHFVRGQTGFEDFDSADDYAYVGHNWDRIVQAALPPPPP